MTWSTIGFDHIPVSGGDSLASFAAKSASRTKGHWTLDKVLSNGDEAVAEWTMTWTPLGLERQELLTRHRVVHFPRWVDCGGPCLSL